MDGGCFAEFCFAVSDSDEWRSTARSPDGQSFAIYISIGPPIEKSWSLFQAGGGRSECLEPEKPLERKQFRDVVTGKEFLEILLPQSLPIARLKRPEHQIGSISRIVSIVEAEDMTHFVHQHG